VLREIHAVAQSDEGTSVREFDAAFFGHLAFIAANKARASWMGLTRACFVSVPVKGPLARYYRQLTRLSSAFAFAADMAMFGLGASLKRRERLSARLGDILSQLYLASSALKRFHDDGSPADDLPFVHWSVQDALTRAEEAFYGLFQNMPRSFLLMWLRLIVFPWGREFAPPADALGHEVCRLAMTPGAARDRLTADTYLGTDENDAVALLEAALAAAEQAEPMERKIRAAKSAGTLTPGAFAHEAELAAALGVITHDEARLLERARTLRRRAIMVDDFPKDLGRTEVYQTTQPVI
jgi:acyl-CoA dehydrogenase